MPRRAVGRELDWFKSELTKRYELKEAARLGSGKDDHKEGRILNRIVRWTHEALIYEAGPRQGEKSIRILRMEGSKSITTPVVRR